MTAIVSRIRQSLDLSSRSDSEPRRPSLLHHHRRSSSVPPMLPANSYISAAQEAFEASSSNPHDPASISAIAAAGASSGDESRNSRQRFREQSFAHNDCTCCTMPTHEEMEVLAANESCQSRRGRTMSLTLCVDELDLKRGKRNSISSSSQNSSLTSPTSPYMPGRDCPIPKGLEDPLITQRTFNKGMPLSFAKHSDQTFASGKRRRLGDPM